ncbi:MAG TPA: hypothetical protein VMU37_10280 [Caulobacteraceae bacterium]|nr:hypothetical protein [Caulobacteraceae bacterium]
MVAGGVALAICGLTALWLTHSTAPVVGGTLVIGADAARWVFLAIPLGLTATPVGVLLLAAGIWSIWREKRAGKPDPADPPPISDLENRHERPFAAPAGPARSGWGDHRGRGIQLAANGALIAAIIALLTVIAISHGWLPNIAAWVGK